jgi:hypothetical protein
MDGLHSFHTSNKSQVSVYIGGYLPHSLWIMVAVLWHFFEVQGALIQQ